MHCPWQMYGKPIAKWKFQPHHKKLYLHKLRLLVNNCSCWSHDIRRNIHSAYSWCDCKLACFGLLVVILVSYSIIQHHPTWSSTFRQHSSFKKIQYYWEFQRQDALNPCSITLYTFINTIWRHWSLFDDHLSKSFLHHLQCVFLFNMNRHHFMCHHLTSFKLFL